MAYTYSKISSVTIGSGGASSINFLAIPQNYTDLLIKYSARTTSSNPDLNINFNSVTTNLTDKVLYYYTGLIGSNSSSPPRATVNMSTQTANVFGNGEIYISNYSNSSYKSISIDSVAESNEANNAFIYLTAALWSSISPITSIQINPYSGSFVQYSTATLYGIKAEV